MDIYLTPNGGSQIRFPMLPENIKLGADAKYMNYSIISLGDVRIPRGKGVKEISWSGMFPGAVRKKNKLIRKFSKPDSLIKKIENYRDKGTKCTLLCTGTCINYNVYVSGFKGEYRGGSGDFYYDIKFIVATEIKICTIKEAAKKTTSARAKSKKKAKKSKTDKKTVTYTVKSGDCLWRIAEKCLGDGRRYTEIVALNKDKIKTPNLIYPGQVLTIPAK